jgi:alpha/beta superfamily hydrolase
MDLALLEAHARIERPSVGISETFLTPRLGSDATVALLYEPLGTRASEGWVICHSFGQEHSHLMEHEVACARALAAAGFPTLRYHGQGYGDSAGDPDVIGLSSHLADARDAVALMGDQAGIDRVGVLGARFGGLVAGLVADQEGLPLLALWAPVTQGSAYMRELLRSQAAFEVTQEDSDNREEVSPASLLEELQANGWADVKGLRVSRQAYEEIVSASLVRDMDRFSGEALIVVPSTSGTAGSRRSKLADRLRELGARCEEAVVTDAQARAFGQYHFAGPEGFKVDFQARLERELAATTVSWCRRRASRLSGPGGSAQ